MIQAGNDELYNQKEFLKMPPILLLSHSFNTQNQKNHKSPKSSALGNAGWLSICFLSSQWLRLPVSRPRLIRARWSSGPRRRQHSLGNSTCTPTICSVTLPFSPVQGHSALAVGGSHAHSLPGSTLAQLQKLKKLPAIFFCFQEDMVMARLLPLKVGKDDLWQRFCSGSFLKLQGFGLKLSLFLSIDIAQGTQDL